jgi:hypothetical protein
MILVEAIRQEYLVICVVEIVVIPYTINELESY